MRVLLTGASGFVGGRLAQRFLKAGHEVFSVVRAAAPSVPGEQLVAEGLKIAVLREVLAGRGIDAVVNLAAAGVHPGDRDPESLVQINACFPSELVRLAADHGARSFVQVGSSAEYARCDSLQLITESSPPEAHRLYGASKAAGGLLARALGEQCGLPVAVLRLFNVFGPGEAAHRLFPSLVSSLRRSDYVALSAGTQVRDFMHVDEVCEGIEIVLGVLAGNPEVAGTYNLASGRGTTVRNFALEVAAALGVPPELLRFGALPLRPDDLPSVVGDPGAFKAAFGWSSTRSMTEGVVAAVQELTDADCVMLKA